MPLKISYSLPLNLQSGFISVRKSPVAVPALSGQARYGASSCRRDLRAESFFGFNPRPAGPDDKIRKGLRLSRM
jgi:hypothetical protein